MGAAGNRGPPLGGRWDDAPAAKPRRAQARERRTAGASFIVAVFRPERKRGWATGPSPPVHHALLLFPRPAVRVNIGGCHLAASPVRPAHSASPLFHRHLPLSPFPRACWRCAFPSRARDREAARCLANGQTRSAVETSARGRCFPPNSQLACLGVKPPTPPCFPASPEPHHCPHVTGKCLIERNNSTGAAFAHLQLVCSASASRVLADGASRPPTRVARPTRFGRPSTARPAVSLEGEEKGLGDWPPVAASAGQSA